MQRRARSIARDRRLKTFYEHILRNAPLNFNNKEIQDIQTAVRHMLERVTAQMNTEAESPFKISHIQPCGSMEEKAAILKSIIKPYTYNGVLLTKYIEFDYLAILDQPDDVRLEGSCPGCHLGLKSLIKQRNIFPIKRGSDDAFKSQSRRSIASLCSCFSLVYQRDKDDYQFLPTLLSFEPANPYINGCPSCTVAMDTGCLTVMPKVTYGPQIAVL